MNIAQYTAEAPTGEGAGDPVWLDDEGRAMIVNSHHYTPESIRALIAELKRLEDPQKSTVADFENKDWRTWCGVLGRVMTGLYHGLEPAPQAATGAPDATETADKILADYKERGPCVAVRYFNGTSSRQQLEDAVRAALEKAATIAAIHSQYPIQNEFDRGYDQARKDAAEAIRREAARRALSAQQEGGKP